MPLLAGKARLEVHGQLRRLTAGKIALFTGKDAASCLSDVRGRTMVSGASFPMPRGADLIAEWPWLTIAQLRLGRGDARIPHKPGYA